MRVVRSHPIHSFNLPVEFRECSLGVTVGNFDGVHLGHQALLSALSEKLEIRAKGRKICRAVYTFEPHPRRVLGQGTEGNQRSLLTPLSVKLDLLRQRGVDLVIVQRFSTSFSQHAPEAFLNDFFLGPLAPSVVVVGHDWSFGKGASGGLELLREQGAKRDCLVHVVEPVVFAGERVGSQRVRRALRDGAVEHAAELLGRPYALRGLIVAGDKRGRQIGFPTANVLTTKQVVPKFGVYATRVIVERAEFSAVTNVGVRPTFDGAEPVVESHLFDCDEDLYGKRIDIVFSAFIRPEKRFESVDALREAIRADCEAAKQHLQSSP